MPGYGHDSNGVNLAVRARLAGHVTHNCSSSQIRTLTIPFTQQNKTKHNKTKQNNTQNLRISQGNTLKRPGMGGYRPPFDWRSESDTQVKIATGIQNVSTVVRGQSTVMQDNYAVQTTKAQEAVENALRSKLSKTTALKNLVGSTMENTDAELKSLVNTRTKLLRLKARKQQLLDVNERRMDVRAERPEREMTNDDVQSNLRSQNKLLSISIDKLQTCIENTDEDIKSLNGIHGRLNADYLDKSAAIDLDMRVLGLDKPELAAQDANLQRKNLTHPHNWQANTEYEVEAAGKKHVEATRLRSTIGSVVDQSRSAEKAGEERLCAALKEKLASTDAVRMELRAKLAEVQAEIAAADARKAELEAALADKREPLMLAQQRYMMRKERPGRELVHDEVEDALSQEVQELKYIIKNLNEKIRLVGRETSALRASEAQLVANIADKNRSYDMDARCLMLDGRPTLSAVPPATVATTLMATTAAGTQQSNTMARIEELEEELEAARNSRQAMESTVHSLKASLTRGNDINL